MIGGCARFIAHKAQPPYRAQTPTGGQPGCSRGGARAQGGSTRLNRGDVEGVRRGVFPGPLHIQTPCARPRGDGLRAVRRLQPG